VTNVIPGWIRIVSTVDWLIHKPRIRLTSIIIVKAGNQIIFFSSFFGVNSERDLSESGSECEWSNWFRLSLIFLLFFLFLLKINFLENLNLCDYYRRPGWPRDTNDKIGR
jgi:hypothetical protein